VELTKLIVFAKVFILTNEEDTWCIPICLEHLAIVGIWVPYLITSLKNCEN